MAGPVVVQGSPVVQGTVFGVSDSNYNSPDPSFSKGERQESKCRDPFFALLFYINIAAIVITIIVFQSNARKVIDDTSGLGNYSGYVYVALLCGAFSMLFSALMVIVMMRIPSFLIKTSLIFVVLLSLVWAVFGFLSGSIIIGILGLVFFLIGVCYARAVWPRIPFATANLVTGCTAIRGNCGVIFITFFFEALAFAWTILWCLACFAIFNKTYTCENKNGNQVCTSPNYGYLFLLFLSFYFTHQVIQNTIHVIVAGTVGTWWISPSDAGCCSLGILGSTFRALTTSFGSICFGSLLVAIIQALRSLANEAEQNGDSGIIACIAQCILACLQSIVEYFNKWAFIYVGLYGYSYLEAGKNVMTLFKNRGWDAIVADDLIGNVLFLVSLLVGALTGVAGIAIQASSGLMADAAGDKILISFILGLIVGIVLCSIFVGSIASAVNAVIVLFAEAPAEFE